VLGNQAFFFDPIFFKSVRSSLLGSYAEVNIRGRKRKVCLFQNTLGNVDSDEALQASRTGQSMHARTSVGRIRADGQHGRSVSVWVESLAGLDHKTDHIIRLGEGWGEDTKGGGIRGVARDCLALRT